MTLEAIIDYLVGLSHRHIDTDDVRWTSGGNRQMEARVNLQASNPSTGGTGDTLIAGGVPCQIVSGSGPTYQVTVYADGPGNPSTGTGTLFVLQAIVLDPLIAGTWVVASARDTAILGSTP